MTVVCGKSMFNYWHKSVTIAMLLLRLYSAWSSQSVHAKTQFLNILLTELVLSHWIAYSKPVFSCGCCKLLHNQYVQKLLQMMYSVQKPTIYLCSHLSFPQNGLQPKTWSWVYCFLFKSLACHDGFILAALKN